MDDQPAISPHPDIYDPAFVKGVFDRCSTAYISFSWLFSLGFTERWRKQCVEALALPSGCEADGYDLMAGTGEVWPHLFRQHPNIRRVTAVDISSGMHQLALERLHRDRSHKIDFVEDDVLRSDLPSGSCDFIVSTFGLKTFDPGQHQQLAELVSRALRPGGVVSMIEASDPRGWWLRPLYLFHLKVLLPLIERTLLRGAQDFAMIGTYCSNFGDAESFAGMLRDQGLEVRFRRYFFGCATGVSGRKPGGPSRASLAPSRPSPCPRPAHRAKRADAPRLHGNSRIRRAVAGRAHRLGP